MGMLTQEEPHIEAHNNHDNAQGTASGQGWTKGHAPEHDTELLVGKGQSPKTQI
jgi:hypothetical protein